MNLQNQKCLSVLAAIALLIPQIAFAQGVGNLGQLPVLINQNTPTGWFIDDPATGGPLPVVRDPNGPVWHKDLLPAAGTTINGGQVYTLQEKLVIAGNLSWSDYHEDILTPGWSWTNYSLTDANGNLFGGYSAVNTPATTSQGGSISFFFNPQAPGTFINIQKSLVYSGPIPAFFQSIDINQYPTPEPASLALLGAGGLLLARRRRRLA